MQTTDKCPCASGKPYGECCGPIIKGDRKAATAVELMRARYSAYAVGDVKFLYESSGAEVRKDFDEKSTLEWSKAATWEGIDVKETERGGENDEDGYVSFTAHYTANGQTCEHRERSYFKRIDGEWRFIDGQIDTGMPWQRETPKTGRNDPCPCGSGKKYKKCCGKDK